MKKEAGALLLTWLGAFGLYADTSEMVFYPKSDFSSAVAHFYHRGDKREKYGFIFDKGIDKQQILYAWPKGYTLETLSDGKVKLVFDKTDHYSYVQQVGRPDFVVGEDNGVIKLVVSGGDCIGRDECITQQNILTMVVPEEYRVIRYRGLDHNLKELSTKEWKINRDTYTLFAPNVKGACIYMELEKIPNNSLSANEIKVASEEKSLSVATKAPNFYVYQNKELFIKGDVVLNSLGKSHFKKLAEKIALTDKIIVRVFQDIVAPKRLAGRYPSASLFSQARAESIKEQMVQLGIDARRIELKVIDDKTQKTRVEVSFI